jgi:SP family galactose:H+ symporter-like MFS transporter
VSRFVVLAAAVAALGGGLSGYDMGVVAGAVLFIRPAFGLSTGGVELVVGAALIGATIGAIASVRLTDAIGRRAALLAAAAIFGLGASWSALAPNMEQLVAARVLIGLALVPSLLLFVGVLLLPDTPRWPVRSGRVDADVLAVWLSVRGRADLRLQAGARDQGSHARVNRNILGACERPRRVTVEHEGTSAGI